MRLTKRGERVFAISLIVTALTISVGAYKVGEFLLTHHQVTDTTTCKQTPDGLACDWHWEAN